MLVMITGLKRRENTPPFIPLYVGMFVWNVIREFLKMGTPLSVLLFIKHLEMLLALQIHKKWLFQEMSRFTYKDGLQLVGWMEQRKQTVFRVGQGD